ncbi:hypothetical protein [Roseomonas elaeocarpi]|uniref:Uncharacterized protein n=1 Tax=Roseomonas elaeocarpi TaxID=907779 RepID=A0ABV6JUX6_9PROT
MARHTPAPVPTFNDLDGLLLDVRSGLHAVRVLTEAEDLRSGGVEADQLQGALQWVVNHLAEQLGEASGMAEAFSRIARQHEEGNA